MAFYCNIEFVDLVGKQWPQGIEEKKEILQEIHVDDWDVCFEFEVFNGPYKYVERFEINMPLGPRCYDIWQAEDGLLVIKALSFSTVVVQSTFRVIGDTIKPRFSSRAAVVY